MIPVFHYALSNPSRDRELKAKQLQIDQLTNEMATLKRWRSKKNRPHHPKEKPRRVALPTSLPRREIRYEPDNTECGCRLERIGEDVSEKHGYTPGVFEVERHIRGKWVCRRCERLIQAPVEWRIFVVLPCNTTKMTRGLEPVPRECNSKSDRLLTRPRPMIPLMRGPRIGYCAT